jgi:hypothetical protein
MIDLTSCPSCGAPAEVQWRTVAGGTGGPVEHVKVSCVRRHWYLLPAAWLPTAPPVTSPR